MDVLFTEDDERWRKEIRSWIEKEVPPRFRQYDETFFEGALEEHWAFRKQLSLKLAAKGWLTMGWPTEFGGQNARPMKMAIYCYELAYGGGEPAYGTTGLAPAIMSHGTPEQKKKWLPLVASGTTTCALGASEPDAGSDLSSVKTRAILKGDHFIVNGGKHFTTFGGRADYMNLLVVTDPEGRKRHNLSRLIMDLKSPGVTRHPQYNMSGPGWPQCITYFDDVKVPRENLIGTLNNAWSEMNFDRGGGEQFAFGKIGAIKKDFDRFIQYCRETQRNGKRLIDDPFVGARLADAAIELDALIMMLWKEASEAENSFGKPRQAGGGGLHSGGNVVSLIWKEWLARFANTAMQIAGPFGALGPGAKRAAEAGWIQQFYVRYAFDTHGHGTPELLRMLIATRNMGLPRP